MTVKFVGGAVWPEMTAIARRGGPRRAAIAFLGADAPRRLPLAKGDVLIVNASRAALLSHATSPDALATYCKRGVNVFSSPILHAKVVVTRSCAVVGSANASPTSGRMHEAVMVTNDPAVVRAARDFVNALDGLTAVDEAFIDAARVVWDHGRAAGPPGPGRGAART